MTQNLKFLRFFKYLEKLDGLLYLQFYIFMTLLACHETKTFHFLSDKTYYRSEKKNNKNHRKSREKEKDKKNKMWKKKSIKGWNTE